MFTAVSSPPSQPKFQIFQPPATTAAVVDQENETEQPAIPSMMMPTMTDDSVGAGGVDSSFVDGAVDNSSPTEVSSDNPKEEEQQQQTDGENGIGNDADDHIDDQEDAELETDDWDWTEETEDDDADDDDEALNNGAGQNAMVNGQETAQQMTGGVESNTHSFINPAAIAVETPQHQEPTLPSVSVPAAPSEQMVRTDNVRDPPPPLLPEPTQFTPKPPLPPTAQEQQQLVPYGARSLTPSTTTAVDDFLSHDTPHRFTFLQEERTSLQKFEAESLKRRHEFIKRLYEMDLQLGGLQAAVANEGMDRDMALGDFVANQVCRPLESVVDRMLGHKLLLDKDRTRVLEASKRVSALESTMLSHEHVDLFELRRTQLETIQVQLTQNIQPSLRLESSKADKREGTLVRRLDSIAGTVARRFHEESATRIAAVHVLTQQIDDSPEHDTREEYLAQLKELRRKLREERTARKATDAKILREIHETTDAMKRALLEAAGTGQ